MDPEAGRHADNADTGLAIRIRALTENVRTLALLDVFGRLVRTLYTLATEKEGTLAVDQRVTQQELANRIGASREMVSRIMNGLVKGGYIEVDQKRILIRKKFLRAGKSFGKAWAD